MPTEDATAARRASLAVLGLSLAAFAFITAEVLPVALLPLVAADLRTTEGAVGLLVTAYALVVLVATVPLARLTLRLPRRLLLGGVMLLLSVSAAGSAASPVLGLLLVARIATALAHSLFWAVVVPTAAALVPEGRRGRAVSTVYAGQSVATVVGVPLGTLVGYAVGWRAAFLGVGLIALLALALTVPLLPRTSGAARRDSVGSSPDRRRYAVLIAVTAVAVTGTFAAFTYVNPFLLQRSDVPAGVLSILLAVRGVAGLLAVLVVGRVVDSHPRAAILAPLLVQAAALVAQWAGGEDALVGSAAVVLSGAAGAAFSAALGARVLVVAPGSLDVATAGSSTAYNAGIALGSALGSGVLAVAGLGQVPLVAAGLVLIAVVLAATLGRRAVLVATAR